MRDLRKSGIDWIGDIPRVWNTTRLKFVTKIRKEKSIMPEGAVYIGLENIISGYNELIDTETTYDEGIQSLCKNGDILFNKLRPYLNKVIIAPYDAYCTNELLVFSNYTGIKEYLRYLMSSALFIEKVMSITEGTKMPRADGDGILSFWIVHPNIIEQKNIVDYLDFKCLKIDEAISKRKSIIEKLKEYKTAIITKAVTKGINPDVEMKDSGIDWIGEIPKHWTIKRLKYFADLSGRIGFRGYNTSDLVEPWQGAISLSPSNIKDYCSDYLNLTWLSWDKYEESPEIMVNNGDIIFVKTGSSYGKSAYVDNLPAKSTINPQLVLIKNIEEDSRYLAYCFSTYLVRLQSELAVGGGAIPTMSQSSIVNFRFIMAPFLEQREIVEYLDFQCAKIDEAISKQEQLIAKLEEYRKSIIYYAVTGKIDCRKGA